MIELRLFTNSLKYMSILGYHTMPNGSQKATELAGHINRRDVIKSGAVISGVGLTDKISLTDPTETESVSECHLCEVALIHDGVEGLEKEHNCGVQQYEIDDEDSELYLNNFTKEELKSAIINSPNVLRHPNGISAGNRAAFHLKTDLIPVSSGARPTGHKYIEVHDEYDIPETTLVLLPSGELKVIVAGETQKKIAKGDKEEIILEEREVEVYVESDETRTIDDERIEETRTLPTLTTKTRSITPKIEAVNNGVLTVNE